MSRTNASAMSENTTPHPYVAPSGSRSTTRMSCAASARFIRYAKKSPAGPPPLMAIFIGTSSPPLRSGGGLGWGPNRRRCSERPRSFGPHPSPPPQAGEGVRRPCSLPNHPRHIRRAQMPVGCALKRAADVEQRRFVERFAEQLDSDRQSAGRKSGGQRKRARIEVVAAACERREGRGGFVNLFD